MKQHALHVVQELRRHGFEAYFAGGCVRDMLLGLEPTDYDVATNAVPNEVMRIFSETYAVGAQFGVVLVPVPKDGGREILPPEHPHAIEVATFRSDGVYTDGRHPDQVQYSKSPEEDVLRRDFTINGLLMDPLDGDRVLDFVGGRDDLRAGVIRAIGDPERRFGEDKLRTEGSARRAFELLDSTGLLKEVLPEVDRMHGVEQPPQFHPEGDVWVHTLMLLEQLPANGSRTLAWGALLHDVGKPPTFRVAPDRIRFDGHVEVGVQMAHEICRRLHFSNDDTEQIEALVAN